MAEIVEPLFDVGSIVGVAPADGIVSALADDGSIVVLEAWDSVHGDAIHTAPAGSAIGGGTRRHLFDRELYVDSGGGAYVNVRAWGSITGTPTTVQGYGITNGIRNDQNGTIAGTLAVTSIAVSGGSSGQGKVWFSAADGLVVQGKTGSGNDLSLYTPGAGYIMKVATGGAATAWGGSMIPISDAGNDFGGSSNRWRHGSFSGTVTVGDLVATTSATWISGTSSATIRALTLSGGYGVLAVGHSSAPATLAASKGIAGFQGDTNLYVNAMTGGGVVVMVNQSTIGTFSSTGLTMAGQIHMANLTPIKGGNDDHNMLYGSGAATLLTDGTRTLVLDGFGFTFNAAVVGTTLATTGAGTFGGDVTVTRNAATVQFNIDSTAAGAGDQTRMALFRNGTVKWYIGNNILGGSGDDLTLYSAAPAGIVALSIAKTTGTITIAGSIIPATDNAVDHGGSSNRWRDGYYGRNLVLGGKITVNGSTSIYAVDVNATSGTVGVRVASSTAGDIWYYGTGTITGTATFFQGNMSATTGIYGTIANQSTAGGASAIFAASVNGATAGDPYMSFTVSGVTSWSVGIDNSVSGDPLVFSTGGSPGSSDVVKITTGGDVIISGKVASGDTAVDSNAQVYAFGTYGFRHKRDGGTAGTRGAVISLMSSIGYSGGTGADTLLVNDWGFGVQVNAQSSAVTAFYVTNAGHIRAGTDAAYDVGGSSNRFRDGYFSRDVTIGGTLTVGSFTLPAASWTAATMLNGWTGQAYYWKDPFGIVHLSSPGGMLLNNNGAIMFVLPAGYRPSAVVRFSIHTANLAGAQIVGYCDVDTSGNVRCDNGTGYQNYTHVDGISFAT